jgi:hypothetical protein
MTMTPAYKAGEKIPQRVYKVGQKIPLSEIEEGDIIRFETTDQPVSVGIVNQIAGGNGLKAHVFFDTYSKMLNYYPDQVTDAFVVMLRADLSRSGNGEESKFNEGIKALQTVENGTFFNKTAGRGQLGTTLIVKHGPNNWTQANVFNKGHVDLYCLTDREVVTQIWDKDHGVMDYLMPEEN